MLNNNSTRGELPSKIKKQKHSCYTLHDVRVFETIQIFWYFIFKHDITYNGTIVAGFGIGPLVF